MTEKPKCEICNRIFKDEESLKMHNSAKHSKPEKKSSKINPKKIRNWGIFIAILALVIIGFYFMFSGVKTLPPTDMQGHVEENPVSHVLKEPMNILIQKHMLEHADGITGGKGGIIINYNCEDYPCEEDLIEKLESFAGFYPENVYVAPFKNMDAKIVLTKLNRIEVLENYDEERINNFIIGF